MNPIRLLAPIYTAGVILLVLLASHFRHSMALAIVLGVWGVSVPAAILIMLRRQKKSGVTE